MEYHFRLSSGLRLLLIVFLSIGCIRGSMEEETINRMELSFFHRDSEFSPTRRHGMTHCQKMNQYLTEDVARISKLNAKIERAFLTKHDPKLEKTQGKVDVGVDGTSAVFTIGTYILTMNVGTPPQQQYLVMSTASEFTWLQCTGCTRCFKQLSLRYAPQSSTSYSAKTCLTGDDCDIGEVASTCPAKTKLCTFQQNYAYNQKISGKIVSDLFSFNLNEQNPNSSLRINFGCATSSSGYSSYADGVAGFGLGPYSFPNQMAQFLGRSAFSSCLVPYFVKNVSKIVMGPAAISSPGVSYTPLMSTTYLENDYYYVNVTGVMVGNKTLSIPSSAWEISSVDGSGGTILDVGTTFTFFVPSAYSVIMAEVKAQTSKKLKVAKSKGGYSLCFSVKPPTILALNQYFPNITLFFAQGAKITLQGYHYVDKTSSTVSCVTFQKRSGLNLLGTLIYQDLRVVYDITERRIGFEPTDCVTGTPKT